MYYDFAYYVEDFLSSGALVANLIANAFGSLWGVALYVLTAMGLYTIAKRRAINKAWLAWVPVVNCWLVGCISDQYRYVVKGQMKSKRKSLLILTIVQLVLGIALLAAGIVTGISAANSAIFGASWGRVMDTILVPLIVTLSLLLPMAGVAVAKAIIYYMAMYDLYTSCAPENNVLFLVLSIIFRVTEPFFIFFNRNNDKGMPPRRAAYQEV